MLSRCPPQVSEDEDIYVLKPNGELFVIGSHRSRQSYLMFTSNIGGITDFDEYNYNELFPDMNNFIHGGFTWYPSQYGAGGPIQHKIFYINGHQYNTDSYGKFTLGYDYNHFCGCDESSTGYNYGEPVTKELMDSNLHNLMEGFYGYYISNNKYLHEYYQFTTSYILVKLLKLYKSNRLIIDNESEPYILKLLELGNECKDVFDIIIHHIQETDPREYLLELYKEVML